VIGVDELYRIVTYGAFESINWKNENKYIKVEIDPNNSINFTLIGVQKLNFVPYAFYAKNVDIKNLSGILPVQKGGTGADNVNDLRKSLLIDKVDNTRDEEKVVSKFQKEIIDLKLSIADTSKMLSTYIKKTDIDTNSLSKRIDNKPSTQFVKNYADSVSNLAKIDTASLSQRIDNKTSTQFVKNYADSVSNLAKIDTASLSQRIDNKPSTQFVKNYADSVSNLAKIDTASLSQRIDLKATIASMSDKEDKINKSTNIYADSSSTIKYFAAKTVKNYIDSLHSIKISNSMLEGNIAAIKLIGTDISTVGIINNGTWNASIIGVEYGGTGNSNLNGVLVGNGTNAISTTSYGFFYDTITQTALLTNTGYPIKLRKIDTELTNNILIENESKIKVLNKGKYNLQFSAQLDRSSGTATCYVSIWLRKNGVDIPNTATDVTIQGSTSVAATVAAWNFFINLNANEYIELVWSTDNTTAQIQYSPIEVGKPRPAIPSMILSMQQIY
jgi:hypothetical protein